MERTIQKCFYHDLKPGKVVFKPEHIKSQDILISKYKRTKIKLRKKNMTKIENKFRNFLMLKSIKEKDNQCLQNNGKLIFAYGNSIISINLESMETTKKNFFGDSQISLCAMPNQIYFCINFEKSLAFIIDQDLSLSQIKNIKPREFGTIVYLDGLIYSFSKSGAIDIYDLKKNNWLKAANIIQSSNYNMNFCVIFEGKVIIAQSGCESIRAFDPFSNSLSNILRMGLGYGIVLFVAGNKLYCIQSAKCVYESLSKSYLEWYCIGQNSIPIQIYRQQYSLYNGSIYFVGSPYCLFLYKFNLKNRKIAYINRLF